MNRYPLWKYILVACALVTGLIYTLPNFFGESPAVQVSSAKATLKVDLKTLERVESTLKTAGVENKGTFLDSNGVKVRLQARMYRRLHHQGQGQGSARKAVQPRRQRPAVCYRLEPALQFAAMADPTRRTADVSRSRPAWRRAFPATG